MFVYHFVDPDLWIGIILEKERAAENGGVDFEIGDIGTLHTCIKDYRKFHEEPVCFFIVCC